MQGSVSDGVPALADPAAVDVGKLSVGWFDFDGIFPAAPALRRAVREAADALATAGARVVKVDAPHFGRAFAAAFQLFTADGGEIIRGHLRGAKPHVTLATLMMLGRLGALPRALAKSLLAAVGQPSMAAFLAITGKQSVAGHWRQVEALQLLRKQALAELAANDIDVLLAPPCSVPAYTHGISKDLGVAGSYAIALNALGWPAGVLAWTQVRAGEESDRPITRDKIFALARQVEEGSAGLPVGVQVMARPWHDQQALAVMAALESLRR
jgi:fatty acid amide hydrolase